MLLAGDLGGTKTNLAIYDPEKGERAPLQEATFASATFPSLEALVQTFLTQVKYPVERASIGVAGPVTNPLAKRVGAASAVDLMGFWLVWQTEGGFEGLRRLGMSRSAIYRRITLFRKFMGIHPDEYEMPGVTIDVTAYLAGTGIPAKKAERTKAP